ncbi:alpha-glucosidase/alpha-galactosidase [Candidatus Poribacteria bacterium]|nr:alpha-glucosidase/alpha-galactosidase [Candidatus Poribacteria bacterium]
MPKITIVGGGAYVFPLTEVRDILSFPALHNSTICMYDINEKRNNRNAEAVKKLIDGYELPTKLQVTTDRKEAVKDTDFFICTFQVGGIEAYGYDVNIPRKYGIDQCVGDTFGPGGIFRGLRSLEALKELAEDIKHFCPESIFIQYANPMAINSTGMSRLGVTNIGLCHSVQGTSHLLANEMGLPFEDCSFITAGLNHQAWFIDYRYKGKDVMPLLRKVMMEKHLSGKDKGEEGDELHAGGSERVRTEIMRLTGYFHTESSPHASEYMAYFRKNPEMVLDYLPHRWDYYEICCNHDEEDRVDKFVEQIGQRELTPSHEYGAFIIESVTTGTLRLVHGSVPNTGSITNLPKDISVEVPVFVDREGLRPQVIGDLPPACAAVSMQTANQVMLAVEASFTGDRDLLYAAVAMDPLTGALLTLPEIRKMVDEMLEAEKQWLPAFESKTLITASKEELIKE